MKKGPAGRKDKTERVTGLGRRTREGDSKVESNDSPDIPDRGDIRHPRPPFGGSDEEYSNVPTQQ